MTDSAPPPPQALITGASRGDWRGAALALSPTHHVGRGVAGLRGYRGRAGRAKRPHRRGGRGGDAGAHDITVDRRCSSSAGPIFDSLGTAGAVGSIRRFTQHRGRHSAHGVAEKELRAKSLSVNVEGPAARLHALYRATLLRS